MRTLTTALRQHENADIIVAARLTARSEQFRAHAAECHEIADGWSDLIKEQYEGLARQWLVVAQQAERTL